MDDVEALPCGGQRVLAWFLLEAYDEVTDIELACLHAPNLVLAQLLLINTCAFEGLLLCGDVVFPAFLGGLLFVCADSWRVALDV